jgi:hypothetical protein
MKGRGNWMERLAEERGLRKVCDVERPEQQKIE